MTPVIAEKRFGGRTDAQSLGQLLRAADSDPCALGRKALDVIFFFLKQAFGNEHGHGNILMSALFEHPVKLLLYILPNGIAVWAQDEKSLNAGVIDKLRLGANIGEPLGEILLHISYLFNFFILCHYDFSFILITELFYRMRRALSIDIKNLDRCILFVYNSMDLIDTIDETIRR